MPSHTVYLQRGVGGVSDRSQHALSRAGPNSILVEVALGFLATWARSPRVCLWGGGEEGGVWRGEGGEFGGGKGVALAGGTSPSRGGLAASVCRHHIQHCWH
jgi:hypothetical protein